MINGSSDYLETLFSDKFKYTFQPDKYIMIFNVLFDPSGVSNLGYFFSRILMRVQSNFLIYLISAIIITIAITLFYYSYAMELLRQEARNIIERIKRTFTMPEDSRAKKLAMEKQLYFQRRQEEEAKRKKFLSEFENEKNN